MPERFRFYWPISDGLLKEIQSSGAIVLDANVLLLLYRLPASHRTSLLDFLKSAEIRQRLWIPHQVAFEFFKNRPGVINEQIIAARSLSEVLKKGLEEVTGHAGNKVRNPNPIVSLSKVSEAITKVKDELLEEIQKASKEHEVSATKDPILQAILDILKDRIGNPFDKAEYDALLIEAKDRFAKKTPPGYKDEKPKGGVEEGMGDLILWKQCLKHLKVTAKHMLFVTDEKKEDWWQIVGSEFIGARPELRKEFNEATTKDCLFMSPEDFYHWAGINQQKPASEDLLSAIKQAHKPIPITPFKGSFGPISNARRMALQWRVLPLEQRIEQMTSWFLENFEDPSHLVPHETAEGGYQFINGGPYLAEQEIKDRFPFATYNEVYEAAERVNTEGGPNWVRKGDY